MSLRKRVRSWLVTPPRLRRLLIEAAWELVRARLLVAFALRKSLPSLLRQRSQQDAIPPSTLEGDVRRSIRIAARAVPWTSLCLPNAIAAKRMLSRRGYASTMHLGVGHHTTGDLHAHAWLDAGGRIITGEDGMKGISPLPPLQVATRNRRV